MVRREQFTIATIPHLFNQVILFFNEINAFYTFHGTYLCFWIPIYLPNRNKELVSDTPTLHSCPT